MMDIQKRQIFEFLKRLNLGIKNKKQYVISNQFKNFDLLLIYLFEMRLIKNYKIIDKHKFKIELSYDINGNSILRFIRHMPRNHYKRQISIKSLYKLINKKIIIYPFFETQKGILPLTTCIKYHVGGRLLFWFY